MLTRLRLQNFKSYKDSGSIEFAPLTILVGANNTGKSSILQSLLVLSQTIRDPSSRVRLVTKGDFVDLGGYFEVLHGRQPSNTRKLSIEIAREPYEMIKGPEGSEFRESTKLHLTFSFDRKLNRVRVDSVILGDDKGEIVSCNEQGDWSYDDIPGSWNKRMTFRLRNFIPHAFVSGETLAKLEKTKQGEKTVRRLMNASMFLDLQAHTWMHFFHDIRRVPPHRSHVPFYAGTGERVRTEGGLSGANLIQAFGSSEKLSTTGKGLLESVRERMAAFKALYNLDLPPLDKALRIHSLVADDPGGLKGLNVAAMGEGISQVMPVVAAALSTDKFDTLLIEQPEIHLHPALQSQLSDLFVDVVKKEKRQLIIETHSEHLLLRLRTHVAKGHIASDKVAINYVHKNNQGLSQVERIHLNGRGHFDGKWPKGFFDEAYTEALELARAAAGKSNDS